MATCGHHQVQRLVEFAVQDGHHLATQSGQTPEILGNIAETQNRGEGSKNRFQKSPETKRCGNGVAPLAFAYTHLAFSSRRVLPCDASATPPVCSRFPPSCSRSTRP